METESLPKGELNILRGHDGPVLAVRFNTSGTYCLSCGKVRPSIALIPVMLAMIAKAIRSSSWFHRFLPSNQCNIEQDRTIRLWNPHKGIPIKTYTGAVFFKEAEAEFSV
jgi:mitogen-activated protein kinase organizer 1